ncbi:hydrogenase maturation nickel metallochaperone HypA/HybF [Fusibacter bizertensis]
MHELGVILQIIERVEAVAVENEITDIQTLVLQIGELSSMIPHYVEACYPAAVEGTMLENSELVIEILPGNGRCMDCSTIYNLPAHNNHCPKCNGTKFEVLSGLEFNIKEIVAC